MLLTLSAKSFGPVLSPGSGGMSLLDLPQHAHEELGLKGLNLQTSLLSGWSSNQLDALRDRADKSRCPCLLLIEETPQPLGDEESSRVDAALDRMSRVVRVANRLGCSSVAMPIEAVPDDEDHLDEVAARVKQVMAPAERMEINVLIMPDPSANGLAGTTEGLTKLIRKVGGFRVGSFPDLEVASRMEDTTGYLKAIAPYASAVTAPVLREGKGLNEFGVDLSTCMASLATVGFSANLSIEWRGSGPPPAGVIESAREALELAQTEEAAE